MGGAKIGEPEVFERVTKTIEKLLRTVNRDVDAKIKRDTNIYDELGIDSVEVMDLLGLLEAEFGVSVDVEKAVGNKTVGDITKFVLAYL